MPEPIVTSNEESLRTDLRGLVGRTLGELLNGLLDEGAGDLVGAERCERTAGREAYRAGHYEGKLATASGEVTIGMPELKGMRFAAAIIERCRRRETSVEEAMIETHLAGVSTRRIEDVSEILCLVKSPFRKRAWFSFGFGHEAFSGSGASAPLVS